MSLWNSFRPFFAEVSGHEEDFGNVAKGIESYINQIHIIDPDSTTFRYDRTKSQRIRGLEKVERMDILHFCQNMEKLTNLMEGVSHQFSDALDWVNEMRREYPGD